MIVCTPLEMQMQHENDTIILLMAAVIHIGPYLVLLDSVTNHVTRKIQGARLSVNKALVSRVKPTRVRDDPRHQIPRRPERCFAPFRSGIQKTGQTAKKPAEK